MTCARHHTATCWFAAQKQTQNTVNKRLCTQFNILLSGCETDGCFIFILIVWGLGRVVIVWLWNDYERARVKTFCCCRHG